MQGRIGMMPIVQCTQCSILSMLRAMLDALCLIPCAACMMLSAPCLMLSVTTASVAKKEERGKAQCPILHALCYSVFSVLFSMLSVDQDWIKSMVRLRPINCRAA